MSVYRGRFARLYDLFYADKPYELEAAFVDRILRDHAEGPSERLLDVACGTGQHAVRLAGRGWDVVGTDLSPDMLALASERGRGRPVEFIQADMRDLDLPSREFDAATCLFDSIGYGVTNDAIAATLAGIRRHLRLGALFVVEFWHAAAMIRAFEPVRVREWQRPDELVLRISTTRLDVERQVAQVSYSVHQFGADGRFETWLESHENRFFLVQEMDLLLRAAGFKPLRFHAGFDSGARVDASTWHVVCLARAAPQADR